MRWQILTVATGILLGGLAFAQEGEAKRLGNKEDEQAFNQNKKKELNGLLMGIKPFTQANNDLLELASRALVFKVTWWDSVHFPFPGYRQKMDKVHQDFKGYMETASKNFSKNAEVRKAFAAKLVPCFQAVFKLSFEKNRIASLNAALMLPQLARLKQDPIGDFLAGLIKDPSKHDAIKLYALKAMPEVFPAESWVHLAPPPKNKNPQDKMKDIERVEVLLNFIKRKWDPNKEDQRAYQFLRREAIKALAAAAVPAVEETGTAQKVDGLKGVAAYTLLMVLSQKSDLEPPPSLGEKIEAAIGICQIRINPNSTYLPDVGIYRTGKLLVEFVKAYQKDFNDFAGTSKNRKLPMLPWKVEADRLLKALEDLKNNTSNMESAHKNARSLEKEAKSFLVKIKTHNALRNEGAIDTTNIVELSQFVDTFRPKTRKVFTFTTKEEPIGN